MNKIVNSPEQKAGYSKKGPSLIFLIQIYLEEPLYEKCQIKKKLIVTMRGVSSAKI